jgi:predicted enzyme related to lactoylglutathione lyase
MGTRESYEPGTFSWAELATTDGSAAKEFYGRLFGWEYEDSDAGEGGTYSMASVDGQHVGAIFQADGPARWNSYITVKDVAEATQKARDAGANVHADPFDVMEAGKMAVIQDPTGGVVSLWEPKQHIGAGLVNAHGALTWNDLMTYDVGAAAEFYTELFGWEVASVQTDDDSDDESDADSSESSGKVHVDADDATDAPGFEEESDDDDDDDDDDSDDGDDEPEPGSDTTRGSDERLVIKNGDRLNGGMATIPRAAGETVPPHWLPYFAVDDVAAAVKATEDGGGTVMAEPMYVPAGRFAVLADPQGAVFAVFAGEFDE